MRRVNTSSASQVEADYSALYVLRPLDALTTVLDILLLSYCQRARLGGGRQNNELPSAQVSHLERCGYATVTVIGLRPDSSRYMYSALRTHPDASRFG